jgi:hypothetical protein
MPRIGVVLSVVAIAVAFPGVARAGNVTVPNGSTPQQTDWLGVFRANAGETNALVFRGAGTVEFIDTAAPITGQPLIDSVGCSPVGDGVSGVLCQPVRNVDAYLGDMNDEARTRPFFSGVAKIWTGSGDDIVATDSFAGYTRAYGEAGDDDLAAGGEGGQLVDGGPGDDRLRAGGFAGHATGLGGPGADRITFGAGLPQVSSGQLEGGPGDDHISLSPGIAANAYGDNGADVIDVPGAWDPRFGGPGVTMSGGAGSDTLSAGPLADVIDGGGGRDTIDAAGGGSDTVTCGGGDDEIRADSTDNVSADCEDVTLVNSQSLASQASLRCAKSRSRRCGMTRTQRAMKREALRHIAVRRLASTPPD